MPGKQALQEWPELDKFDQQWPVTDIVKVHLQHSSQSHKIKQKAETFDAVNATIATRVGF